MPHHAADRQLHGHPPTHAIYGAPMSAPYVAPIDNTSIIPPIANRLIRLDQVSDIVGLGKTLIYRLISEGRFPRPLKLGLNASRWSEIEVQAWIAEQVAARSTVQ